MIVSIDLGVGEDVMKDCLGDVREVIAVVAYLRSEQMRSRGLRAVPDSDYGRQLSANAWTWGVEAWHPPKTYTGVRCIDFRPLAK